MFQNAATHTADVIEAKPGASGPTSLIAADPVGAPSPEFLRLIPQEFARRHLILSAGPVEAEAADPASRSSTHASQSMQRASDSPSPGESAQGSSNAPNPRGARAELLLVSASTRPAPIHNVGVRLGRPVVTQVMDAEPLAAAIDRAYAAHHASRSGSSGDDRGPAHDPDNGLPPTSELEIGPEPDVDEELRSVLANSDNDLLHVQGKAPMVRLVDLLLFEAVQRQASDIHIQPLSDRTLVRYRLDGVLHTVRELPPRALPPMVGRVKVMARLDVAERGAPQDGRATVTLGRGESSRAGPSDARRIDLRISTLPTTYGERVVIRLLDTARSPHLLRFAALGMPPEVERPFQAAIARTSGIVLSTGPTGSGKTTTLYTTLAWISGGSGQTHNAQHTTHNKEQLIAHGSQRTAHIQEASSGVERCALSVERSLPPSPRPSPLPTAHSPLPSPSSDLNIMTIEDPVEYDLSIAGLSISQTQLNTKKGVTFAAGLRHILRQDPDVIMVGEIRDEETARVAVQASLTGHLVLSTLHTNDAASAVARLLDLNVEPFLVGSTLAAVLAQRLVRRVHVECGGRGCPACLHTGYKGRTGVFELLTLDAELRDLVARRVTAAEIKSRALAKGMVDLQGAGRRLVASGVTTREELERVIEGVE